MLRHFVVVICLSVWAWAFAPDPAHAGRCQFDSEVSDITSGQMRRTVQDRLAHGWQLGFQQIGEQRSIFVTVGVFGANGAIVPAGQRLTFEFEDGTVMHLVSTRPAQPQALGVYAEYTFWLGTTDEALQVFSNLDISRFQVDVFGELTEGTPDRNERHAARWNASCIQDPSFRG